MVLLIYHFDKNDNALETFFDEPMRLDLGYFPKKNTRITLKMLGWNNNTKGGNVFIEFPDVVPYQIEHEHLDYTDNVEVPGLLFQTQTGQFRIFLQQARGRWYQMSDNRDLDLDLGVMDTQKDYFTIKVNARRALDTADLSALNNISVVLEMHSNHIFN